MGKKYLKSTFQSVSSVPLFITTKTQMLSYKESMIFFPFFKEQTITKSTESVFCQITNYFQLFDIYRGNKEKIKFALYWSMFKAALNKADMSNMQDSSRKSQNTQFKQIHQNFPVYFIQY